MTSSRSTHIAVQAAGAAFVLVCVALAAWGFAAWQGTSEPRKPSEPEPRVAVTTSPVPLAGDEYADPSWAVEPSDGQDGSPHEDKPVEGPSKEATPTPNDESPAWRPVLDGFARDFNRVDGTGNKAIRVWREHMARWVTPQLAEAYKTVDPRMLPNTTLDGIDVQSDGSEAVTGVINYHGIPAVWVLLQPTGDGWRVTQAEPAESN